MYGSGPGGAGIGIGVGTAGTLAMTGTSVVSMVACAAFLLAVGFAMLGAAHLRRRP